jgi:hypothetical protein
MHFLYICTYINFFQKSKNCVAYDITLRSHLHLKRIEYANRVHV